jgi:hypothetical protein
MNGFAAPMSAILILVYIKRMHHKLHEEGKMKEKHLYKISMLFYCSGTNFSSEWTIGAILALRKHLRFFAFANYGICAIIKLGNMFSHQKLIIFDAQKNYSKIFDQNSSYISFEHIKTVS